MRFKIDIRTSLYGDFELDEGVVHLWHLPLAADDEVWYERRRTLSKNEQTRASNFHLPRDQRRFVMARSTLRELLAGYDGQEPTQIDLSTNTFGKPFLVNANSSLQFNLAHSEDTCLFGFVRNSPMGVDLEDLGHENSLPEVVDSFCAPTETNRSPRDLIRRWTAKEAFVKALGTGLQVDPTTFSIDLDSGIIKWKANPTLAAGFRTKTLLSFEGEGAAASICLPV